MFQVNLGVIEADPSSTKGVVQIMKHLNQYVAYPHGNKEDPHALLVEADQLSVERMVGVRVAMADHDLPKNTLRGLEPSPQEFHHRVIALQVQCSKVLL